VWWVVVQGQSPLFNHLIPSLCNTMSAGFVYSMWLGYDHDDPILSILVSSNGCMPVLHPLPVLFLPVLPSEEAMQSRSPHLSPLSLGCGRSDGQSHSGDRNRNGVLPRDAPHKDGLRRKPHMGSGPIRTCMFYANLAAATKHPAPSL
jgi:hypothetical protein